MYVVKEKDHFLAYQKSTLLHVLYLLEFFQSLSLLLVLVKSKYVPIQPNTHMKSDKDLKNSLIVIFDLRDRDCDHTIWIDEKLLASPFVV